MRIPLIDLKAQHAALRDEIDPIVREVIESAAFIGGPWIEAFERDFAAFCGARHAVAVGNGTDALALALRAAGIGPGDEVITAANSFIASAEAILIAGAQPVFVDVDEESFTLSPESVERAVTIRTRAILPVHLYGQPAAMHRIVAVARRHGLRIIEDACQAHGAEFSGLRAGTLGDAAAFSFYPGKNLGAWGDAGAVVTDDDAIANEVRLLRNHGRTSAYAHAKAGINSRVDTLQAAILQVKLRHLAEWNERRSSLARAYRERLSKSEGLILPAETEGTRHAWHLYVVRTTRRDALLARLRDCGIDAAIHYPTPLHRLEAFESLGLGEGSFPVAERLSREILSLPLYPEMTLEQIDRVSGVVTAFTARATRSAVGSQA